MEFIIAFFITVFEIELRPVVSVVILIGLEVESPLDFKISFSSSFYFKASTELFFLS